MRDDQWEQLLAVIDGKTLHQAPVGFIIDCPWLAGWSGNTVLEYLSNEELWFETNRRVVEKYPDVWFFPGFWAEFAMCTEPSAFGCRCIWPENEFPFPQRLVADLSEVDRISKPDCRTSGMLPFVVKRLARYQSRIEDLGHRIRFATSRGHLNVASYLVGQTELLLAMRTDPELVERLLALVTDFIVDWLQYQREMFPDIEGVLVLDDIVGFVGENDFRRFALPYLKRIYTALDVPVRMWHNDAHGLINARYLEEIGVNIFNFSFEHSMPEMRAAAGDSVVLLGNIPPRDVLAQGTPDDVQRCVAEQFASIENRQRIIWSAGGGVPPGVSDENMQAFLEVFRKG